MSWMQDLHCAVANEDHTSFKTILASEEVQKDLEDIIQWDFDSQEAPLHQAALMGNADMVRKMVDAGADINR